MAVSQPCPGRVLRATVTFAVRIVRRAARILRDLHRGQMRMWEIIWQASRAVLREPALFNGS